MKRQIILAGILLVTLAMAMSPLTAAYSSSQRGTIHVVSGTGSYTYTTSITGTTFDMNLTPLPWLTGDMNHTECYVYLENTTSAVSYNITENTYNSGVRTLNTGNPNDNWSLGAAIVIKPAIATQTYWHVHITFTNINYTGTLKVEAVDAPLRAAWLTSVMTYAEQDNATPKIASSWAVYDNLTCGTLFDAFDANLKIQYPSTLAGTPSMGYYPWNGTTLNTGTILSVPYYKYGPAHNLDSSDITATSKKVAITFNSQDQLKKATWNIDPAQSFWNGAFNGIDQTTFAVLVNGHVLPSDDVKFASIDLKNVDIVVDTNNINFTWAGGGTTGGTGTAPPTTTAPNVLTQEAVAGVPNWALGAIIIIIVIAGYAIWKNEKKPKK